MPREVTGFVAVMWGQRDAASGEFSHLLVSDAVLTPGVTSVFLFSFFFSFFFNEKGSVSEFLPG